MSNRVLVLRRQALPEQEAELLAARLLAQPGVLWVGIDTSPFCVTIRIDESADEAKLRALVLPEGLDSLGGEGALRLQARLFGSLLPIAARALAAAI
jgi:hypothetical protein